MTDKVQLKIGLDYHGVVNVRPEYFAAFAREALRRGHEVHIITGGPYKVVEEQLKKQHIVYTRIFAILDYYDARGEVTYFENGEYHIPDKLWDSAKAEYCSAEGINMHIDDSREYIKWFTTPYCHYENSGEECITENGRRVDFNTPPAEALDRIEQIVSSVQYY